LSVCSLTLLGFTALLGNAAVPADMPAPQKKDPAKQGRQANR